MKAKNVTGAALITLFCLCVSVANAQVIPSTSISIIDNTPSGPYHGSIALYYLNNGTPVPVGTPITVTGLALNSLNQIPLTWGLPEETDENVYILVVQLFDSSNIPSVPNTFYSSWFNTPFYYNNTIPVTVRFS